MLYILISGEIRKKILGLFGDWWTEFQIGVCNVRVATLSQKWNSGLFTDFSLTQFYFSLTKALKQIKMISHSKWIKLNLPQQNSFGPKLGNSLTFLVFKISLTILQNSLTFSWPWRRIKFDFFMTSGHPECKHCSIYTNTKFLWLSCQENSNKI